MDLMEDCVNLRCTPMYEVGTESMMAKASGVSSNCILNKMGPRGCREACSFYKLKLDE